MDIPRPEYPRPLLKREQWACLNGAWTCRLDHGVSGLEREWHKNRGFETQIVVPFCLESALSGVGHTDFVRALWYHRTFVLPRQWAGQRILLHFGAVDYECEAFVDGVSVGTHYGGSSSFSLDITRLVRAGEPHHLVVRVYDDIRAGRQPAGKQSTEYRSSGAKYTRVTGIWQTVWLEAVDPRGLEDCTIVADLDGGALMLTPVFMKGGGRFRAVARTDEGEIAGEVTSAAVSGVPVRLPLDIVRPWSPDSPHLYALELVTTGADGEPVDTVSSYAGLRTVRVDGDRLLLNGEPLYLRFVLDQGYYPDGIWTAPSDEALRNDIELALDAGFNGARLHQKVFEQRYHYWADRLGFLTWAESANWGMDHGDPGAARNFLGEWHRIVTRDRNHPSIIAWTPFNETPMLEGKRGRVHDELVCDVYEMTRALDPTRPVNGCSGWHQCRTDLFTAHNYQQNANRLARDLAGDGPEHRFINWPERQAPYEGQPYFLDEFGGTRWGLVRKERAWGYGDDPESEQEFLDRVDALTDAVLQTPYVAGYCYTQLYDIEQEQNGLYTYERRAKFDMNRVASIFGKTRPGRRVEPGKLHRHRRWHRGTPHSGGE
jgi:beta-galactosidase/beta-glucuronidase